MADALATPADHLRLAVKIRQEVAVAADLAALCEHDAQRLAQLADVAGDDARGVLAALAVGLAHWYTAVEATVERVERAHGATVATGAAWHRDLLLTAAAAIPSLRPPILEPAALPSLLALMGFRHFMRHAYTVQLDPIRLLDNARHLALAHPVVAASLERFATYLDDTAKALAG